MRKTALLVNKRYFCRSLYENKTITKRFSGSVCFYKPLHVECISLLIGVLKMLTSMIIFFFFFFFIDPNPYEYSSSFGI